jgi:hypothetical protein
MYEWILAIDACFKLSSKYGGAKRSHDEPSLAPGSGVFVKEDKYQDCLKKNRKAAEVCAHQYCDSEPTLMKIPGRYPYLRI